MVFLCIYLSGIIAVMILWIFLKWFRPAAKSEAVVDCLFSWITIAIVIWVYIDSWKLIRETRKLSDEKLIRQNEGVLLTEMPYERSDYVCVLDKHARNAYTHLAKLLLYKNTTNDANGWINDIINNFTLPMLTAKVYISAKARAKVIFKGYIENLFGAEFEDYDEQMENFCYSAIRDMEGKAVKEGYTVPQHDDIKQSISLGKNIIVTYAQSIAKMANGIKQETANATLQNTIRTEVKKAFGIDV